MANNLSYKSFSKFYDIFDLIFLLGRKGNPRLGLLDVIGNTPRRVLDVGVGTAASALLVAGHNANNHIVGIDISDTMLAVAQRRITQRNLSNLEVFHMSATDIRYPDDSFDVVMASFALHEFEHPLREKVFHEISRVLKPGGIFCVIDFAPQDNRGNQIFLKLWELVEPPCFTDFLDMDWRTHLTAYGMQFESEREFSFSKLYLLRKT